MNTKLLAALLTGAVVFSGAETAVSARDLHRVTIKLENNTGYTIRNLYLSDVRDGEWGPDVLSVDELPTGFEETIWAPPGYYDLMLVDKFDDKCEVRDIDLTYDRAFTIDRMDLLHCQGY